MNKSVCIHRSINMYTYKPPKMNTYIPTKYLGKYIVYGNHLIHICIQRQVEMCSKLECIMVFWPYTYENIHM